LVQKIAFALGWLKSKNPASEAVRREREEEWGLGGAEWSPGDAPSARGSGPTENHSYTMKP